METDNRYNGSIKSLYRMENRRRIVSFLQKASLAGILFILYVICFDLYYNRYPIESFYWRLVPLSTLGAIVLLVFSPLKKFTIAVNTVFFLLLTSIVTMSWGRLLMFVGTGNYYIAANSMIVGILCVFLLTREGALYFASVCLLPSLYFIPALFISHDLPRSELNYMGNPLIVFVACLIMSEIQDRLRFNEYRYKKITEHQNFLLQEKSEQMSMELQLAKKIQLCLIPRNVPPFPGVRLHAIYKPLAQVGGDFYDFIVFDEENRLGIFIGDVAGHGVPAALITSMLKTLINTAYTERCSPRSMLQYINDKIMLQTEGNYITAFYGIYDQGTRTLLGARAGHTYPLLIRNGSVSDLVGAGRCIGLMDSIDLDEKRFQLEAGDKVVFYTDGITEATDGSGESFEKILRNEICVKHAALPIHDFIDTIDRELIHFKGDENYSDDLCIIGMEIL
ncbi:MAG: SpoIIE family protein phosphatase [Spirochaetes bacterium]|nr:SpoIIE family protein phosphatase [Spirochaetota bacterium]